MNGLGGIGQQVGSEILDLAKKTVTETAKAAGSVVKGTTEVVTGASGSNAQQGGQAKSAPDGGEGIGGNDPLAQIKAQNKAKAQQRYNQLMGELDAYRQREAQKRQKQEEQIEEQSKIEEIQKKESDKRKREEDLIRSTQRQYGGTGEAAKKQF